MRIIACYVIATLVSVTASAQTPQSYINHAIEDLAAAKALMGPPVITVPAGGNVQTAIDGAAPGSIIQLTPGATYAGGFTVSEGLTVQSANWNPAAPVRAIIAAATNGIGVTCDGVATIRGLEIVGNFNQGIWPTTNCSGLVEGNYVHGSGSSLRGIVAKGSMIIQDNLVDDIYRTGAETHGIWIGEGGPHVIKRNTVLAAGINAFIGGEDVPEDRVPHDILIGGSVADGNTFVKKLAWRGAGYSAKNLFEIENAKRVVVTYNRMQYSWRDGQSGFCVGFTVRNQSNTAPWSTVEDVLFAHNHVSDCGGGITLLGEDDSSGHTSQVQKRIKIHYNLFENISKTLWADGFNGRMIQIAHGTDDLEIIGNVFTGPHVTSFLMFSGGTAQPLNNLIVQGNDFYEGSYGIFADGVAIGVTGLAAYAPGYTWSENTVRKNGSTSNWQYPAGTTVIP